MVKNYSFMNAAPFKAFIEAHKDSILGKPIRKFYANNVFGSFCSEPLAFEFDDFVLVLFYFFYSDLRIYIVDPALFHSDETLNFLHRNVPGSRNVRHYIWEEDFPYTDFKIVDISIERFFICAQDAMSDGYVDIWD